MISNPYALCLPVSGLCLCHHTIFVCSVTSGWQQVQQRCPAERQDVVRCSALWFGVWEAGVWTYRAGLHWSSSHWCAQQTQRGREKLSQPVWSNEIHMKTNSEDDTNHLQFKTLEQIWNHSETKLYWVNFIICPFGFSFLFWNKYNFSLGALVQCSWRQEKPRLVCDWFAAGAGLSFWAATWWSSQSPFGWMVHWTGVWNWYFYLTLHHRLLIMQVGSLTGVYFKCSLS